MPFQALERIKIKHPRLSANLVALEQYVGHEVSEGRMRIIPALAANYLRKSEAETLALLMLLEDAGLLTHEYDIVCKRTGSVLKKVSNLAELEDAARQPCRLCDTEHGCDDLRTDLVFEVKPAAVQAYRQHAFA